MREPLVHFVAAGIVLFAAFAAVRGPDAQDARSTIVVDRRALLTFMQYRANAFEPGTFSAALDSMSDDELRALVDAYVDEEALYREAKALGLEGSDYVIRQRMIQKVRFLLGDVAAAGAEIEEDALADYFATHRERYSIEPSVTFTHVFFDAERRGGDGARRAAREAVRRLNETGARFSDAHGLSDGFPFLRNYVERTLDYVGSHFGAGFAAALAAAPASDERWQGPLESAYGYHAVLLTRRTQRRRPTLEDVRDEVERDYRQHLSDIAIAEMTRSVRDRYRIVIAEDLADGAAP